MAIKAIFVGINKHLAMNWRDACQCLHHIEAIIKIGFRCRLLRQVFVGDRLYTRCHLPKRAASHDLKQPRAGKLGVAQLVAMLPRIGETVLNHILGNGSRPRQRRGAPEQKAVLLTHPLVVS